MGAAVRRNVVDIPAVEASLRGEAARQFSHASALWGSAKLWSDAPRIEGGSHRLFENCAARLLPPAFGERDRSSGGRAGGGDKLTLQGLIVQYRTIRADLEQIYWLRA